MNPLIETFLISMVPVIELRICDCRRGNRHDCFRDCEKAARTQANGGVK